MKINVLNQVINKSQLILSLLTTVLLIGCDSGNSTSLSAKSIIYCSEGSPASFNPQTITSGTSIDATSNQLYDRLLSFNPGDDDIKPALAKSWHVTRDGKMITFYLRKNVEFHQTKYFTPTRTFNADDVLFSFNRILDQNHEFHSIAGVQYPFFESVNFSSLVNEIEKINDYTVRFKLNNSDSSFLSNLASDYSVIISSEYGKQLSQSNKRENIDLLPIGTGPFKLKEYRAGSFIRYYPHEKYWREKAQIEQLIFDITPNNTSRLTKLLTGGCDVLAYPIAHKQIKKYPNLTLDTVTSLNVGYLGFNTKKPPFDNKLVRTAVAYAINRKAIIETIYSGQADIAKSLLPKSSWAYDDTASEQIYSIETARILLHEAGYPNGFTMNIWAMPVRRAYNPDALTMAKLIQADLLKIGIQVKIVSGYEWEVFLNMVRLGEHESVLLGWSADHPDPDNFLTPILSCDSAGKGSNNTQWCHKGFDKLLQDALQSNNINQRKKYYAQALAIVAEEIPLLPIAHSKRYQARSTKVKGKLLNAFGGIDFRQVSKK
ncbi:MAG: ABC transporter substrate-binding protein [Alteromonadaceae bacterium]|nr:ABC transporter substrate-binding protein [Alteromonadaceae bacterium]